MNKISIGETAAILKVTPKAIHLWEKHVKIRIDGIPGVILNSGDIQSSHH